MVGVVGLEKGARRCKEASGVMMGSRVRRGLGEGPRGYTLHARRCNPKEKIGAGPVPQEKKFSSLHYGQSNFAGPNRSPLGPTDIGWAPIDIDIGWFPTDIGWAPTGVRLPRIRRAFPHQKRDTGLLRDPPEGQPRVLGSDNTQAKRHPGGCMASCRGCPMSRCGGPTPKSTG